MRQIVLDTETTGLDPRSGHRIIEVACIEMENRRLTGRHLHKYINPEREIDAGAQAVHGITLEFLADKPKFADIVDEFLEFISGGELVIHNAPFDLGFLNAELRRLDRVPVETICNGVTDTLKMAKELQRQLGTTADGVISGQWPANERYLWAYDRGVIEYFKGGVGSNAVRALQDKVGCKVYPVVGGVQARQMGSGTVFKHQQWLIAQGISCGSSGADGYQGRDTNVAIGQALVKQLYR